MLKRRRNARCTAVADSVLTNLWTQKILCCIVAILPSTDTAARLCAWRVLQRWYLKILYLLFQMLCRSFPYNVQFTKYRRTKLSPSFRIILYIPVAHNCSISLVYLGHYAFRHGRTIIGHECAKALRAQLKVTEKRQDGIQLYKKLKSENPLLQFNDFSIN